MKNQFNVKTILGMVGIIALVAAIGFLFAACDNGTTDDGGSKSVKVTVTLQNTLTGNYATDIVGVVVYQYATGPSQEIISYVGGPTTNDFDETKKVVTNGTPITFSFTTENENIVVINGKASNDERFSRSYLITTDELKANSGGEIKVTVDLERSGTDYLLSRVTEG